ncbi:10213_t:CDS:2 [Cetraspora pellucida]|uniref:10213_t:CDS:1 n=1 Tax=Cetraspora pellucida TaxID=1433469 RepID=A0A9N9NG29_9GLOM|nr:10213_t:CDS:2 [Cetraspora pellucida]
MYYYLAAIVAVISYFLYKCYFYPLYLSPLRKVPGPPVDNLILGHYASFLNKGFGEAIIHLIKQYGVIVKYHAMFNKPYLLISDQKLIQQILVNRSYDYPKFFLNKARAEELIGQGIVIAEGDDHKRQRKMMAPSFSFTNVKEMVPTFIQTSFKLRDIWIEEIGNKKEERISITEMIPKITLDIIGFCGFYYEFNSTTSNSELARAYHSLFSQNPSPLYMALVEIFPIIRKLPTAYNNQYYDACKTIFNISERLVAEGKDSPVQGTDLLSLLVKKNECLPVDEQLTHEELVSQVMTLLMAGHETTSNSLSWALYFLAKNPDAQDRLRKELLDVLTHRDYYPTIDEIDPLKYLDCVLKETLRIVPPVPVLIRYNSKNEILNDYFIPKETPIMIPIYAINHDPLIWGDDAEEFKPSRWLDPDIKTKVTSSNYLSFGAGPRNCLGMKMAQLEFKSLLSVLIRNFEFKLVEGFNVTMKLTGFSKPVPGIDLWVSKLDY